MKLKIAVLPGDGIGPEIMPQAINVLNVWLRSLTTVHL
jgi:3-isopropylmalate dehydrogenase